MKLLVTGGRGGLGRAVVRAAGSGDSVVGVGANQVDVCERDAVVATLRSHCPEVVINCAAFTNIDGCVTR